MDPGDFGNIHKILIVLSMKLRTGIDFFYNLPFYDVLEIVKEVAEIGNKQRIQNGNKNRRRN